MTENNQCIFDCKIFHKNRNKNNTSLHMHFFNRVLLFDQEQLETMLTCLHCKTNSKTV